MTTTEPEIYYDPYDFEVDTDPYPIWRRMREEQPLYRNDKYDFWALSRFEDVEDCLKDFGRYSSARGTILELLQANIEMPPGSIIFEDPPDHDVHRGIMSRVFTPKKMAAIEPEVRRFCAATLDPHIGDDGFDFIADLGAQMPMRTIGMLLGIPESDQEAIRDRTDEGLRLKEAAPPDMTERLGRNEEAGNVFAEYIDWRADNPSDDLMTELLNAEFTDIDGEVRTLTREEVLNFVNLLSGAGNETTQKLIGWTGKVLGDHPDQRRQVAEDRSLINQTIEELLRYEAPSPVQARFVTEDVVHHGETVPAGSAILLVNGSANRDDRQFENGDSFDIHRKPGHHLSFGYGAHFCLGAALARLEGRVALDEVLNRWPDWEVDEDAMRMARTSTVRGWESLPVHV